MESQPSHADGRSSLLASCLAAADVRRVFGVATGDLSVVPVDDHLVARRLAEADGRLGGVGVASLDDGQFVVTGGPAPAHAIDVDDVSQLPEAVAAAVARARAAVPEATRLRLGFDPAQPPRVGLHPRSPSPTQPVEVSEALVDVLRGARAPLIVAGPGVVRAGCVDGLRALAATMSAGVLNTWGAKGVFDWRSPHHLATGGLQARDFELAGLGDADCVVFTGVDPAEARSTMPEVARVEVEPPAMASLVPRLEPTSRKIVRPALYELLANVTQAGWARDDVPLAPTRITRTYSDALGDGGLIAADPGVAGFFVARSFPTSELGSVAVPGAADSVGFAVCAAGVSRMDRPDRPALAVVDGPLDEVSSGALEALERLGVPIAVETWSRDGHALDADAHQARLKAALGAAETHVVSMGYEAGQLDEFVDTAGEIVAWQGEEHR